MCPLICSTTYSKFNKACFNTSGQNSQIQYWANNFSEERIFLTFFCLNFLQVSALFGLRLFKYCKPSNSYKPHTNIPISLSFQIIFFSFPDISSQKWLRISKPLFFIQLWFFFLNPNSKNRTYYIFLKPLTSVLYQDIPVYFFPQGIAEILKLILPLYLYWLRASVQKRVAQFGLFIEPNGHTYLNYFSGITYN